MKRTSYIKIVFLLVISTVVIFALSWAMGVLRLPNSASVAAEPGKIPFTTVIIDAGHGGEDGGTSSASGLIEKDVNLDISNILRDMLKASGINVVMTREDDRLLYDRNVDYHGRKKKLDLAARLAIADSNPEAILVSIHMNSFTDPRYSGMQVWYSPNHALSPVLAESIRAKNQALLQPDNYRETKSATSGINLLYNIKCPAVLVECGFLSNPEEAERYETTEYRKKAAMVIYSSIIDFLGRVE